MDFGVFGGGRRPRRARTSRSGLIVGALIILIFILPLIIGPLIAFLTDLLWFRSLGYEDVFLLRYTAAFWAFLAFFLLFFALAVPNLYFALRPRVARLVVDVDRPPPPPAISQTLALLPFLLLPALLFGIIGAGQWDRLLRWRSAVPFGVADPAFGNDIGFYVFTLPVLEFVRGWLIAAVILISLGVVALYAVRGVLGIASSTFARGDFATGARMLLPLARPARAHLSVLGGLFLLLVALGYPLDQFGLLFRDEGVLTGMGYTSATARLPALAILTAIVGIAAIACFANAFARTLWVLGGALALWIVASVLVLGIYPALVQTLVVRPDELNRERPYLERHIAATRDAWGLAQVEESAFDPAPAPSDEEARAEFADPQAVRLWDYRPLLDAYQQIQALRQYYRFTDVDVDRYEFEDGNRPVMLSARELDQSRLPVEARTWQNQHLVFTHGIGAVMTPMGAVTGEGLPSLVLQDIPTQGLLEVEQPRIYYGELTNDYVIVGTTQDEFDYAREGGDARYRYTGGGGVGIGGLWDRLLFAIRFGDLNLLISQQIGSESGLLFHRNIAERAQLIAPFLDFDVDPYLVVADGKLWWITDAYTTADRYPYSERLGAVLRGGERPDQLGVNYIRNSVKVVTDAYDGTTTFYVVDEADPVLATLRRIYPSLFSRTVEDMPDSLRAHLRYPEDLFRFQVEIFAIFHMTNVDTFYNRGDAWKIANETLAQGGQKTPIEPYYVRTQLPGSDRQEFVLFVPMTPAGEERDNMVAWIAGRADPPEYGRLRALRFPQDRVIFGPLQIEARIEADATIRQQITLLSAGAGAQVIRGNLLVLPVGQSFLYVEPLFVQASQGRIPELKRVILATQDRIAMDETFELALARLFGAAAEPLPPPPPPGGEDVAELIQQASEQFERAQAALRALDFAEYGRQIALLEETLGKLRDAAGR